MKSYYVAMLIIVACAVFSLSGMEGGEGSAPSSASEMVLLCGAVHQVSQSIFDRVYEALKKVKPHDYSKLLAECHLKEAKTLCDEFRFLNGTGQSYPNILLSHLGHRAVVMTALIWSDHGELQLHDPRIVLNEHELLDDGQERAH